MKRFLMIVAAAATLLFTSCNSKFYVRAIDENTAVVAFNIKYSKSFIETGKAITGTDDLPVNGKNIAQILTSAGFEDVVSNSNNFSINASGLYNIKTPLAAKTQILKISKDSIELQLGPEQFKTIYELMNEEEQSYFDLLMIPCLSDEESTPEEYQETVASLYGPTFAKDLSEGVITLTLTSSDQKKTTQATITLGELFTLKETKTWKVEF